MKSEEIENYLLNRMDETDRAKFEDRMAEDRDFMEEVASYAAVFASFDQIRRDELSARFKTKSKISGSAIPINRQSYFQQYWKIAASIIVIMLAGGYFLFQPSTTSQELYALYYSAYPNVASTAVRSGSEIQDEMWAAYDKGNYDQAYKLFEEAVTASSENLTIKFYLGISAMELQKYNQARQAFSSVASTKDAPLAQQAEWYLALSYLAENNLEECKSHLKTISESKSSYTQRAAELLDELD